MTLKPLLLLLALVMPLVSPVPSVKVTFTDITTAAGIWMTTAVSIAIGMGQVVVGLIGTTLASIVLAMLYRIGPNKQPDSDR